MLHIELHTGIKNVSVVYLIFSYFSSFDLLLLLCDSLWLFLTHCDYIVTRCDYFDLLLLFSDRIFRWDYCARTLSNKKNENRFYFLIKQRIYCAIIEIWPITKPYNEFSRGSSLTIHRKQGLTNSETYAKDKWYPFCYRILIEYTALFIINNLIILIAQYCQIR